MNDAFGFPVSSGGGGDFIPVVKYNAKAGRVFRVDRVADGNGFSNEDVDITPVFKAIVDFDNIQCGWMLFAQGQPPSFALISMTDLREGRAVKPDKPSPQHKDGVRFMLKLNRNCASDRPVREMSGSASSFLDGVREVYLQYMHEREKYPGQLPKIVLVSTQPVKAQQGTNYRPVFRIDGWAPRPADLITTAPSADVPPAGQAPWQNVPPVQHVFRPSTGSQTVSPPNNMVVAAVSGDDDFG